MVRESHPIFDPYQPLEQSIKSGDILNRWILLRPRQRIRHLLKGQRVLDVCCGTGNLTAMLVAAGCQVVGIDSSPTMLSHARAKHIAAEFIQMNAAELPFQQGFDAAVISLALHEMPEPARVKVWESMRRAVRPGGRLIALDFAVSRQNGIIARIIGRLIEQDERGMLAIHPEHYENFREFMQNGGLIAWLQKQGQAPQAEYRFLSGTVAVTVTRSSSLENGS